MELIKINNILSPISLKTTLKNNNEIIILTENQESITINFKEDFSYFIELYEKVFPNKEINAKIFLQLLDNNKLNINDFLSFTYREGKKTSENIISGDKNIIEFIEQGGVSFRSSKNQSPLSGNSFHKELVSSYYNHKVNVGYNYIVSYKHLTVSNHDLNHFINNLVYKNIISKLPKEKYESSLYFSSGLSLYMKLENIDFHYRPKSNSQSSKIFTKDSILSFNVPIEFLYDPELYEKELSEKFQIEIINYWCEHYNFFDIEGQDIDIEEVKIKFLKHFNFFKKSLILDLNKKIKSNTKKQKVSNII